MADKVILEFYPLDFDYTVENNEAVIRMYGVTKEGKSVILIDNSFKPYFYAVFDKKADLSDIGKKVMEIKVEYEDRTVSPIKLEKVTKNLLGKKTDTLKITVWQPHDISIIKDELKKISEYEDKLEYDIPFVKRYIVDKKIVPLSCMRTSGESVANYPAKADLVIRSREIVGIEENQITNPNILAFDIETYNPIGSSRPEIDPILMISFASSTGKKKVITWKKFEGAPDYVEFVNSEPDLIKRAIKYIDDEAPSFIVGYNSDGFDFPYIAVRAKKYKQRFLLCGSIVKFVRKGRDFSAKIKGLVHIDIYQFVRNALAANLETEAFDLNSVAEELIGEKKHEDIHPESIHKAWDEGGHSLKKLAEYCMHDSYITLKLAEKLYPNIVELTKLVGQPVFDVSRMTYGQSVEWYLIKNAAGFEEFIPNKPIETSVATRITKTYIGAYVHEPKPGVHENIVVFDFRSLYPSIIVAYNICPTTMGCTCCEEHGESWFCTKKKGFVPSVLDDLINRRARIKEILKQMDKKDENYNILSARSYALKTVANAMYGYLGFARSRWYCIECASAITSLGRQYIKKVIDVAEEEKFGVIYSDTDSVMLSLGSKKIEDSEKFVKKFNKTLPKAMELEFQGFYPRGIFVSKKSDIEKGAKKKYALVDEDGDITIRGFEYVRRDWSEVARETQMKVIKAVLIDGSKEKALEIVKDIISKLRANKISAEDVSIYTQLTRNIESYESIGPHVAAAMKATKKGRKFSAGQMIKYIVTKGEGSISDRSYIMDDVKEANYQYDPEYYINNQVIPAVEKIFEVMGYSKDELLGKLQTTLAGFFK